MVGLKAFWLLFVFFEGTPILNMCRILLTDKNPSEDLQTKSDSFANGCWIAVLPGLFQLFVRENIRKWYESSFSIHKQGVARNSS